MFTRFLFTILIFLTLAAHADGVDADALNLPFKQTAIQSDNSGNPPTSASEVSYYGDSEDPTRAQQLHQEEVNSLRDRILNALGISKLVPRGSFSTVGIQTHWSLSTPNRNTLQFTIEARW